jgi:hypothetical protein
VPLAYCIVEAGGELEIPATAVEGAPVRSASIGALRCFWSDFRSPVQRESLPEMAKAFHEFLQRIFAQTPIIPFRFPTIVGSEKELLEFIESRSDEYRGALRRLRDKVQMDIRIVAEPGCSEEVAELKTPSQRSGKEYLRAKGERHKEIRSALNVLRGAADAEVDQWVERDTPLGMRAFALLSRSSLPAFLERIRNVRTPGITVARVTGPWPPSEFVEINDEQIQENKATGE